MRRKPGLLWFRLLSRCKSLGDRYRYVCFWLKPSSVNLSTEMPPVTVSSTSAIFLEREQILAMSNVSSLVLELLSGFSYTGSHQNRATQFDYLQLRKRLIDRFPKLYNSLIYNWNRDLQRILFKNGMQLFEIKTDTLHTAMLSQYLNQSNTFQPLKYIASELDCANCDLVCYQLTTIFIATVLVRSREIVYLCKCDRERRALVVRLSPL